MTELLNNKKPDDMFQFDLIINLLSFQHHRVT